MPTVMTLQESRDLDVQEILKKSSLEWDDITKLRGAAFSHKSQRSKVSSHLSEGRRNEIETGALYWALGQSNKAITALEAKQSDVKGAYYLLRSLRDARQFKKAVDIAIKAIAQAPGEFRLHSELMYSLEALSRWDDLAAHVASIKGKFNQEAEYYFHLGFSQESNGERDDARASYEKALTLHDRHAEALFRLARLYDIIGDDNKSIDLYERCRQLLPLHANAVLNLGVLYEDQENYEKAIYCFQQVLNARPDHARARLFMKDAIASLNMIYDEEVERKYDKQKQILNIAVTDFELSVRSRNCLNKMNIRTLGDLVRKTEAELLSFKNFGETSLAEIKQILTSKGLRLGLNPEEERISKYKLPVRLSQPTGPAADNELLGKPLGELDLSVRSRKCMERLDVNTIGGLLQKSEADLLAVRNFGQASVNEIKQKLAQFQLKLKD